MLTSSKTYEIIRESGFIRLPSQRTLCDYTHWIRLKLGFNAEVFSYLRAEAKVDKMADWERYIMIWISLCYLTYSQVCSASFR